MTRVYVILVNNVQKLRFNFSVYMNKQNDPIINVSVLQHLLCLQDRDLALELTSLTKAEHHCTCTGLPELIVVIKGRMKIVPLSSPHPIYKAP